ncbi:MAG: hypothetical protein GVY19_01755 [Bacteroidetes bacterium]|jgi:hypothetical protein|nr:hypothetical protein [Bacteroidota bacterium]
MTKRVILILFITAISFQACKQSNDQVPVVSEKVDSLSANTGNNEIIIANPIVYDVIIENLNKDDLWQEESLKNFSRQLLVNQYFQAVYNGEIEAYDLFTDQKMSREELKEFEQTVEFDRSKVGKIQFYEQWYLDTTTYQLRKQVKELVFGYHKLTTDSVMVGYKPVFRIYMKSK